LSRRACVRALIGACAVLSALGVPAAASATTLWVSPAAPSAPFNSCAHPGYDSIQAAVGGPGTAIHVCAGTYEEQLQIERNVQITGFEGVTLKLPAVTANATTACDKANETLTKLPDQDAISICGGKVTIKNVNVDAIWPGEPIESGISCAFNLTGILVAGGANLNLSGSTITGAAPQKINGCQYGLGILIGIPESGVIGHGSATLTNDTVTGYQKNGITAAGGDVEAHISKVTVTGAGPQPELAQNGIGIQEGATATITKATVSGNECDHSSCGPDALDEYQSDGVYFYGAASNARITDSTVDENDVGVEAFDSTGAIPFIDADKLVSDRYESVLISEGAATVNSDTMTDANVGIELLQFGSQSVAPSGTGTTDKIEHMAKWAVFGRSDNSPEDKFGAFTITKSKISGSPGPRPLESVESENPTKLKIFAEGDR